MSSKQKNGKKAHLLPKERQLAIYQMIKEHGAAKVPELAKQFDVSEMTVRRDLEDLEQKKMITRTRGGAVINHETLIDLNVSDRMTKNLHEKTRIAEQAAALIEPNELIALDASTSCLELSRFIKQMDHLKLVTNSLLVATQLAPTSNIEVFFCGGELRNKALSTIGPMAENNLSHFNFTKAFISGNAFDSTKGLMDTNLYEIKMKQIMISHAKDVIVLSDSSKLQKFAFHLVCPPEKIDVLITDHRAKPEDVNLISQKGIRVIVADP